MIATESHGGKHRNAGEVATKLYKTEHSSNKKTEMTVVIEKNTLIEKNEEVSRCRYVTLDQMMQGETDVCHTHMHRNRSGALIQVTVSYQLYLNLLQLCRRKKLIESLTESV